MNLNTKRFLAVAAIGLTLTGLSAGEAVAQTSDTKSPTLTVTLKDALSLTMNVGSVNLTFETVDHYRNGVTTTVNNQFTVTSNKPYNLTVRALGDLTGGPGTDIPVSNISVAGTNTPDISGTVASLSQTDQSLAAAAPAVQNKNISLLYTAAGSADFLKPAGNYATTLTFTATQN